MIKKKEQIELLVQKRQAAHLGGGQDKIDKKNKKGQLTARQRIDYLLDKNSFEELGVFVTHRCKNFGIEDEVYLGDGVVTGYGTVSNRLVYVYAQDFTVFGGSLSESNAQKIVRLMDLAMQNGAPIIGLNDSGGARIQEGVLSLAGYADIFYRNARASGVIPQISAIMGPAAGGAVYSPALTDFVFMVQKSSYMFITGPKVVKTVTHENITSEELGGSETHSSKSGVCHFNTPNDVLCLDTIKKLLGYIPQNCEEIPPNHTYKSKETEKCKLLNTIIPENANASYDMLIVIEAIVDKNSFFEVHQDYAQNIIVGFAYLDGKSIGIVANQPKILAGVLDIKSSLKGARFVRFCDAFNIPLLVLEDVPGFLPGSDQEWGGIITHGAKLLYAFAEATVPRITIITRKAYGGAYDVMNSKHIGADLNYAWPSAEIAVMGSKGAAQIIFKKEINQAQDKNAFIKTKETEYTQKFANPYEAAQVGFIDEVIMPDESRIKAIKAFQMLTNKVDTLPKKKHSNLPL